MGELNSQQAVQEYRAEKRDASGIGRDKRDWNIPVVHAPLQPHGLSPLGAPLPEDVRQNFDFSQQNPDCKYGSGFEQGKNIPGFEDYGKEGAAWYRGITVGVLRKLLEASAKDTVSPPQQRGLISSGESQEGTYVKVTKLPDASDYAERYAKDDGTEPFVLEILGYLPFIKRGEAIYDLQARVYLWMLSDACKKRIIKLFDIQSDTEAYKLLYPDFTQAENTEAGS